MSIDRRFVNVLILCWSFMIMFSAVFTTSNIEKTVLDSIANVDKDFTGDGYTSMSIIYASYATFLWIAPSYISLTSARISIITGSIFYIFHIAVFLWPQKLLLYTSSAFVGLGASLLWTGQGKYLIDNSDASTISRNTAIFWTIYSLSSFAGNLFVYLMFSDTNFEASTRKHLFITLTVFTIIASVMLTTLGKSPQELMISEKGNSAFEEGKLNVAEIRFQKKPLHLAGQAMKNAFLLFITPQIIILSMIFIYSGLILTFYSGVYSPSIGFVIKMGESRKNLISLSGVCIGFGECISGLILGTIIPKMKIRPGWKIVYFGFFLHSVAFLLIFLNLPNKAPFQDTEEIGFIEPSPSLCMAGGVLLGMGDACINTQIYYLLGKLYARDSGSAFAIFNFFMSFASAISFYYSNYLGLYIQLGILLIVGTLGSVAFSIVDHKNNKSENFIRSDENVVI